MRLVLGKSWRRCCIHKTIEENKMSSLGLELNDTNVHFLDSRETFD
jgi:hypothetical protein